VQLQQDWLVVGWAVQAAVLVTLGVRLNSTLLYQAGQIVWGITLLALVVVLLTVEPQRHLLFLNERGLSLLATVVASAVLAGQARKTALLKDEFVPVYQCVATLGGAWLLAQETYEAFYYWHVRGRAGRGVASPGADGDIAGVDAVRSGDAGGWHCAGGAGARLTALGLLGLTTLKVFLYDLSFLDTPMRILSFGGLGVTLIGISWLYSRYGIGKAPSR